MPACRATLRSPAFATRTSPAPRTAALTGSGAWFGFAAAAPGLLPLSLPPHTFTLLPPAHCRRVLLCHTRTGAFEGALLRTLLFSAPPHRPLASRTTASLFAPHTFAAAPASAYTVHSRALYCCLPGCGSPQLRLSPHIGSARRANTRSRAPHGGAHARLDCSCCHRVHTPPFCWFRHRKRAARCVGCVLFLLPLHCCAAFAATSASAPTSAAAGQRAARAHSCARFRFGYRRMAASVAAHFQRVRRARSATTFPFKFCRARFHALRPAQNTRTTRLRA